jgi:hypothetical protein
MDSYVAEVCFADQVDLSGAIAAYNSRAVLFQTGLQDLQLKYKDKLAMYNGRIGVETVDNIDNCTIKLKALPEVVPTEVRQEIVALFNTTWSR